MVVGRADEVVKYLNENCITKWNFTLTEYLFGIPGFKGLGLNHILLELKKAIFYSKLNDLVSPTFTSKFLNQVRLLMIKGKAIFMKNDNYIFF